MLTRYTALFTIAFLWMLAGPARAGEEGERKDRIEPAPAPLRNLTVTEHPDAQLPLNLDFKDDRGADVKLGQYFEADKPVILTLNYYECPMLCTLILNGMVDGLRQVGLKPGQDYEIVSVSFNPKETFRLAQIKKRNYVEYWGDASAKDGWHFLTGNDPEISGLTGIVGFEYRYIPETGEFAHPSVIMIATPDGRLSRYLYGVKYDPQTLRLSLVDASEGKIGSPMDQILLFCFHYDSSAGRYAPVAFNIMRLGGAITVLLLAIALSLFWSAELRRRRAQESAPQPTPPSSLRELNA